MSENWKKHGFFSWNELMTTDTAAARDFYTKLFGWTYEESKMSCGGTYYAAKIGDDFVGGMFGKNENVPAEVPPHWGSYVTVDDVEKTVAQVRELGGNILLEPMDIPELGRFAVIQDVQGAVLSIITYTCDCA